VKEKAKICIITHKILKSIKCRRVKILGNEYFWGGYLSEIPGEIVGLLDLSDYFCNHSEMDFEQQKIVIRVNLYLLILAKKSIS
jgi:hypothetical protein